MKRFSLVLLVFAPMTGSLHAQEPGVKQTIAYVQKLQTPEGGFRSHDAKPDAVKILPTLRSTSAAVRALHYLGGEIPNKDACIKYVASCHDPKTGGFADTPGGKPDVFTTAVGLMAVTELKVPTDTYADGAIRFMAANAKSFEDIRIAAAGLERLGAKSPVNDDWLKKVINLQHADGTFGKGPGAARDTGGSVVTLLRLGAALKNDAVHLKTLKEGQRRNGGYGKEDDAITSDLETTYRVMRCFVMLKARPSDVEGIRSFVAKCRNEDGGYAIAPGQPSSVGGTYFAAIITHWLKQ